MLRLEEDQSTTSSLTQALSILPIHKIRTLWVHGLRATNQVGVLHPPLAATLVSTHQTSPPAPEAMVEMVEVDVRRRVMQMARSAVLNRAGLHVPQTGRTRIVRTCHVRIVMSVGAVLVCMGAALHVQVEVVVRRPLLPPLQRRHHTAHCSVLALRFRSLMAQR